MARVEMEKAKGTADMQAQLAAVGGRHRHPATTKRRHAKRRRVVRPRTSSSPVRPRPPRPRRSVSPKAKATEALGLARAAGYEAQTEALGQTATALVAVANAVADGHITVVPEVLVTGGGGGALDGLAATLMRTLGTGGNGGGVRDAVPAVVAVVSPPPSPPPKSQWRRPARAQPPNAMDVVIVAPRSPSEVERDHVVPPSAFRTTAVADCQ